MHVLEQLRYRRLHDFEGSVQVPGLSFRQQLQLLVRRQNHMPAVLYRDRSPVEGIVERIAQVLLIDLKKKFSMDYCTLPIIYQL
ncbi:hypothetical protein DPMN_104529 [Dreissena polymorpha]|uniref:Uncharacterized protein n=1 Tax=Dreissena polymorpha TaxID=45954 RepID=A0A9D4HAM7_DREPO|nr:hypothetical protein DPMN_104529 [Dreissena polymorpha]